MRKEWILTFPEVKACLAASCRYVALSKNTFVVSLVCVAGFLACWLTLAGVSRVLQSEASLSLFVSYFLFMVAAVSWSLRVEGTHKGMIMVIGGIFISILSFWNYQGLGILDVLSHSGESFPLSGANAFISMDDLIATSTLSSLWNGFYWIALCFILLPKFRADKTVMKDMAYRLLINFPVWVMQVFVFSSLSLALLLASSLTNLPVIVVPLLMVWNCVFVFLVLVRIENGTPPGEIMAQIARIKLTLRT